MASIDPKAFDGIPLQIVAIPLKGPSGEQGDPGKAGVPGKSNYQLWLEAGNTGTIEDFLLTTKGEKGDTGAGLINRGEWTLGTYQPGEFVGSFKSGTDLSKVVYVLIGDEEYISTLPPYSDPAHWMMLDIKAGIPDAPIDGKQYVRKDGDWAVLTTADVPRVLTIDTTSTVNPLTKYAEWEAQYGFATDSSDWDSRWNVDDAAAIAFSGARAGESPAIVISSEGQVCWDYLGSPTGTSVAIPVLPPDISRAYWIANPRPWLMQSFHPVGQDCEGFAMIGHAVRGVGLIFKGQIRMRSTPTNYCQFAMRFIGGSMELYLRSFGVPVNYGMYDVGGNDIAPTFTLKKPNTLIPAGGYMQAHWAPPQ